jgi:hypothetical protein
MKNIFISAMILSTSLFGTTPELQQKYDQLPQTCSLYGHLGNLRELAQECSSVVEIGIAWLESTTALFLGLSENPSPYRSYVGIDISSPYEMAKYNRMALENGLDCTFLIENDLNIDIPETAFLFIDSLHIYAHLSYELEKFSPKVSKYIAMHDTSAPYGETDEPYSGDYSEYPAHISRTKRGLWLAVEDFLAAHPEWRLLKRKFDYHGFTVLERIQ